MIHFQQRVACGVVATLVALVGCSSSEKASAPTDQSAATTAAVSTTQAVPTTTAAPVTTVAEAAPSTPPPTTPAAPFSAGVVLVGTDIAPGIYEADVPSDGPYFCYWERLNDASSAAPGVSSSDDAVIAAQNPVRGTHVIVEILATDAGFNSYDCGGWTPFAAPESPATSFGPGTWLVGQQIVPGHYVSTGDPTAEFGCYWARLSAVTGWSYDVIAYPAAGGEATVDIDVGDFAFDSHGCGNWTMMP